MAWVRFSDSLCGPQHAKWKSAADRVRDELAEIRVSAIGAFYRNPLDPLQTETAREIIKRAIEVAAFLKVPVISAFAGSKVVVTTNERGGNPQVAPLQDSIPDLLAFWEPLARTAAEAGVKIAFENCPQSPSRLPIMGYNAMALPAVWERLFSESKCQNLGIEWDPSHLICQMIDPVENAHHFASRIFHVHAKDAFINRPLMAKYGITHPGVLEHRMPGLGDCNWAQIIHTLLRHRYAGDLNIEGWHDPVYKNHTGGGNGLDPQWEETGLLIAKRTLEQYCPPYV